MAQMTVAGSIVRCSNPAGWHPTMHAKQDHHHPPLSWRRNILAADPNASQSWWLVLPLCGICHDEVHALLNRHVALNGPPPYAERRTYSPFVQRLVAEAWAHRPAGRLPYTITARFVFTQEEPMSDQSEPEAVEQPADVPEESQPEVPHRPGATLPGGQRVATDEAK